MYFNMAAQESIVLVTPCWVPHHSGFISRIILSRSISSRVKLALGRG
jgi:hypothetical protein